ncbi:hypothetical protein Golax_000771, partial [Gossypium laxum]|nr:hypothetical protein [Gossypium laxum]
QPTQEIIKRVNAYIEELGTLKDRSSESRKGDSCINIIQKTHIPTVFAMEALACLQAIRSGLDLGLQEMQNLTSGLKRGRNTYLIGEVSKFEAKFVEEDRVVGFSKKMEDREKLRANENSGIIAGCFLAALD